MCQIFIYTVDGWFPHMIFIQCICLTEHMPKLVDFIQLGQFAVLITFRVLYSVLWLRPLQHTLVSYPLYGFCRFCEDELPVVQTNPYDRHFFRDTEFPDQIPFVDKQHKKIVCLCLFRCRCYSCPVQYVEESTKGYLLLFSI